MGMAVHCDGMLRPAHGDEHATDPTERAGDDEVVLAAGALGGEGRAARSLGATRNRASNARRPAGGSRTIRFEYTAPGSYFLNKSLRWAPARFDARSPRSFAARSQSIWPDT